MTDPPAPEARLVVGIQPVREALRAHGREVQRVLLVRSGSRRLDALARFATDQGVAIERVARDRLDRMSGGVSHQGVAALAPPLELAALEALATPDALVLALDGITDPHNLGAAIRSAVALGASAVLWGEHHSAPLGAATFRASAGAIEHARLCRVPSLRRALGDLDARGLQLVSLELGAEPYVDELDLASPTVLVIGSEDVGVRRGVRQLCGAHARLRMSPTIGSLNASVAAALALYEAQRQRRSSPSR